MNEREIFTKAIRREGNAARRAFVEEACGGDAELRRGVEGLLEASERVGSFLESPSADLSATADYSIPEESSALIGPYKLLDRLGEGGFGVVFMAEQTWPMRRRVALKVLKPGMDSRQVVARFEAERQALALMEHPNIAKVYEGGTTASGQPYFVMELVHGVPITNFCDQTHQPVDKRLGLFVDVCRAVHHAHQKGVIHRDLKPSNVLVTMQDAIPVVKVIDFGIAKAAGHKLTEKTLYTNIAHIIGTPLYMSPEQAERRGLDVDTRTDIYALGVLLYELLTGTTPFDKEWLETASYDEIRRIIREEEPARPSMRLSTLGKTAATVSANRASDPKRLSQLLCGELDWVVMKALEKDRNRRYETAIGLAKDVQRYLNDEPVQACPPSTWYRFRKFARRNKGILATVGLVALALVAGTIVSAWQAIRTTNAERLAQTRLETETEARKQADYAFEQAKINSDLAEDRASQIRRDLERLKAANALLDRGRWYVGQQRWDDAHTAFTKAVDLRPDYTAAWVERSELLARLGLWDLAAADFAREFELREPDIPDRWYLHALLRLYVGDLDGYRLACRKMREHFRGTNNTFFAAEVVRTCMLCPEADADVGPMVAMAQNAVASAPKFWFYLYVLGVAHYRAGEHEQAVRRLRESLAAEPNCPARAIAYPVLSMAHYRLGQAAEARQARDDAARAINQWTRDRYQHQDGKHWVMHLGAEASWPIPWCDWLECRLFYREAKILMDGSPPVDDPRLRVLRARSYAGLRWQTKADGEYADVLQLVPYDPQLRLEAHRNRGFLCAHLGQWRQAAAEFARASDLQADDAYLWRFRAAAHVAAGEVGAYRQTCAAMVKRFQQTKDPRTAYVLLETCVLQPEALPDMVSLIPLGQVAAPWYPGASRLLAATLYRAGKYDEAVRRFETAAKASRPRSWDWSFLAMAHHRMGHAAEARRCLAEAARWIDEANRQEEDDLSGTRPAWGDWHERAMFPLLLREAEELIRAGAATPTPSQAPHEEVGFEAERGAR
jgi:serine/threonine protein kinase/Tfp pilus assembly protein PilF